MSSSLPVVAAIPNYNMADELAQLLPQLLKQDYLAIYVLDDASTDHSRAVVRKFPAVNFIAGQQNLGAGGNRNRILEHVDDDVLIHFIDADTRLDTADMIDAIRQAVPDSPFAFMGGLAKSPDGRQSVWNYGPGPGLRTEIAASRQFKYGQLLATDPEAAKLFHKRYSRSLQGWPDPQQPPVRRQAYWCIEQNIVFHANIFRRYNGFDEAFRETEIGELSIRMERDGLHGIFDPSFSVIHTEAHVRQYDRSARKKRETIRLAFRYGIIKWLTGSSR